MRLIDADVLINWLRNNVKNEDFYKRQFSAFQIRLLLENENTIDAVEVVHGRWANNGISELMLCKCTVCGFPCSAYAFNYCPNCGAKMDGDENGTLD